VDQNNNIIKLLFSKFLPNPTSIGVEVSDHFLKLVLVKKDSPTQATLLDYSIIPLAPKTASIKPNLGEVVKNILTEKKLFSGEEAKFAISGSLVDTKRIVLPFMPKEEIPQALRWEAKENFLLDIDESIIDFEILGEKTDETGTKRIEVIANIAKGSLVVDKISLFKNTQVLPSVVIPAAYGLYNLYRLSSADKKTESKESVALIDVGLSNTTIVIVRENRVRFVRQCGCAGSDFTNAMSGTIMSDKGTVNISPEKAEELKKEIGVPDESMHQTKDGFPVQQIVAMIRPVIEKLDSEIKRSFNYCESQLNEGKVSRIYLTGGTSKLKNLQSELSKRLSTPVENLTLPNRLKVNLPKALTEKFNEDFPHIAASIGAALSEPTGVNLIPEHYKKQRLVNIEKAAARAVFTIACLVMVGLYLFEVAHGKTLENLLLAKKTQWQKLEEIQVLHSKIIQKNAIIDNTLRNQPPFYSIFKSLSRITPGAIHLENMTIREGADILKMRGFVLGAKENEEDVLARFLKALEGVPFFGNVHLNSSHDVVVSGKSGLEFEISCKLK